MSEPKEVNRPVESVLLSACDDWTGLWEVALDVREISLESREAEVRRLAIEALTHLLSQGWVRIGDLISDGFMPWDLSDAAIIRRIDEEWSALGRDPDIGEIGWLTTTAEGDAVSRRLAGHDDAARG